MRFIIIDTGAMCQTDDEGNIISTGIVGRVERSNAAFMFAELPDSPRLEDLKRGDAVFNVRFKTGAGSTFCDVYRVE